MKAYRQRIQEYRDFVQQTCIREEAGACTIKVCQDILTEQALQMESKKTSYFEFLYEQSRFIKKKMVGVAGRSASVSMAVAEQQCQRHERDNATYGNFRNDVCDFDRSGSLEKPKKRCRRGGTGIVLYASPDLCGESPVVCSSGLLDCHDIFGGSISDNGTYPEQSGCELLTSGQCVLLHLLPRVV